MTNYFAVKFSDKSFNFFLSLVDGVQEIKNTNMDVEVKLPPSSPPLPIKEEVFENSDSQNRPIFQRNRNSRFKKKSIFSVIDDLDEQKEKGMFHKL